MPGDGVGPRSNVLGFILDSRRRVGEFASDGPHEVRGIGSEVETGFGLGLLLRKGRGK